MAEPGPSGVGEWGSPGRSVKAWCRRCWETQLVTEPSMPMVPAMARVTFSQRAGTKDRWLNSRWKPTLSPIPVTRYMPTPRPRSSQPIPWLQKITMATTDGDQGQYHEEGCAHELDLGRHWRRGVSESARRAAVPVVGQQPSLELRSMSYINWGVRKCHPAQLPSP